MEKFFIISDPKTSTCQMKVEVNELPIYEYVIAEREKTAK
jgi:hypothetical protein